MIVSISGRLSDRSVALSWQTKDARLHVWVDPQTLEPAGRIAYKNALVDRHQPGHFETRKLWLDKRNGSGPSPTGEAFNTAVRIARENKLIEAFLAAEQADIEARRATMHAELRDSHVAGMANEILEALCAFVGQYDTDRNTWPDDVVELLDQGTKVIAKAYGPIKGRQ
jgi:hypothetical protein